MTSCCFCVLVWFVVSIEVNNGVHVEPCEAAQLLLEQYSGNTRCKISSQEMTSCFDEAGDAAEGEMCSCLCLCSGLQVDAGSTGCLSPDCGDQLRCHVLLLLRHRLLWAVAADVPQEGLVLSPNTGTARGRPQSGVVTILDFTLQYDILKNILIFNMNFNAVTKKASDGYTIRTRQ